MMAIKKYIATAFMLFVFSTNAFAVCTTECDRKAFEQDGFCYEVFKGPDKTNEAMVVGYVGTGGHIVIPDTLGGYPVTIVGNNSFYQCESITCITVGNNVWLIERQAFAYMPNLACTYVSNSVLEIKESVWSGDALLGTVVFGSSVDVILNRTLCPTVSLHDVYFLGDAPKWAPESVFCSDTQSFNVHLADGVTGYDGAFGTNVTVVPESEPECLTDTDCPTGFICTCSVCEEDTLIELGIIDATWKDSAVVVNWITDTEIENAYFNLYRAESINTARTDKKNFLKKLPKWLKSKKAAKKGPYVKINAAPIPALGESPFGASYEYIDTDVQTGKRYWYMLEDVDLYGNATKHGPCGAVSAWEDCSYMP